MFSERIHSIIFFGLVLLLASCSDDDGGENGNDDFDRQALLENLADEVIIPAYGNLAQSSEELLARAGDFEANPDQQTLDDLRNAWLACLEDWQKVGFYDFGPAFDNGLLNFYNPFPVDAEKIENNISTGEYSLESASNIDAVGLQAMDYLLYGTGGNDTEILSYFIANPSATQYLLEIAEALEVKAENTYSSWNGQYRTTFIGASGTDIGSSLGQLVNASVRYYERNIRDGKIGIPAGARTSSGDPLPELAECYYSDNFSKDMLQISVTAWQHMFNGISEEGIDGTGLDDYLFYLGAEFEGGVPLHEEINQRFNMVLSLIEPLSPSIASAVIDQQDQCIDTFDEMQRIIVLLKVDMTSAMGIQITYADNDGD